MWQMSHFCINVTTMGSRDHTYCTKPSYLHSGSMQMDPAKVLAVVDWQYEAVAAVLGIPQFLPLFHLQLRYSGGPTHCPHTGRFTSTPEADVAF